VDIVAGAVANGFESGYDESAVPDFERMIGLILHNAGDWKGTRP